VGLSARMGVSMPSSSGKPRVGSRRLVMLAAIVVTAELWVAVSHTRFFAQVGYKNLTGPRHLVREADLDPFSYFAPTQPLVAAQDVIPRDATYSIVVGNEEPSPPVEIVHDIFRFWLVPRGYTTDLHQAQWAITYNAASESLGVPYTKEISLGPGVNAVKLARP
jgi:hypothetical protein